MVERQPAENRTMAGWIQRAASYAALGRTDGEARTAAEQALAQHPDLSIQGLLSRPDFSDAEQRLHEELMRKAGFPLCAQLKGPAKIEKPYRLPDAPPPSHALIRAPRGPRPHWKVRNIIGHRAAWPNLRSSVTMDSIDRR
jgi:hypothetical protein